MRKEFEDNNNNELMVSILCLAYNQERYIRNALDGFLSQKTSFRFEIIIHDDASTDGTPNIIREYQEKYPSIIHAVLQKENQYSRHINIVSTYLLPLVQGKYIAMCEGDDYWCDSEKLQRQVECLENFTEYVACVHNTEYLYVSSNKRIVPYPLSDRILRLDDCVMRGSQSFQTSSLLVRKNLYINRPDFVSSVNGIGDYPNAIYYSLCGPIYYLGRVMSVYRIGTNGSWTQRMQYDSADNIRTLENIIKMLKMADDYSSYAYHEIFLRAIRKHEYILNKANNNYRTVVKTKEFFIEETIKRRFVYRLYALWPNSKTIIENMKKKRKNE